MRNESLLKPAWWLILGDTLTLFVVTLVGFAMHGELATAGFRLLTTFLPLLFSWLLVAPFLRVFQLETARDFRQLWKPGWAMIVATPLAALLRGFWLNRPVLPLFAFVLAGSSALAILVWRMIFLLIARSRR